MVSNMVAERNARRRRIEVGNSNYYQSVQTELVLFAQPTEELLLPLREIKAEEKGLNSGYYAHAQRTRDIYRTRPRGWVKLPFTPCVIVSKRLLSNASTVTTQFEKIYIHLHVCLMAWCL